MLVPGTPCKSTKASVGWTLVNIHNHDAWQIPVLTFILSLVSSCLNNFGGESSSSADCFYPRVYNDLKSAYP